MRRGALAFICLVGITGQADALDDVTDPSALADIVRIIQANGYYCPRVIGAWNMGLDGEYGVTFNVVCPGDSVTGTRYKVSVPSRGVYRVRVGW